jgi:hypothetical protein
LLREERERKALIFVDEEDDEVYERRDFGALNITLFSSLIPKIYPTYTTNAMLKHKIFFVYDARIKSSLQS